MSQAENMEIKNKATIRVPNKESCVDFEALIVEYGFCDVVLEVCTVLKKLAAPTIVMTYHVSQGRSSEGDDESDQLV